VTRTEVDGRTARAARTRDAVVEAFLELLEAGDLRPTARSVAERANVSLRSVYVRFADLDSLAAAAAERQWERLEPLVEHIDPALPLDRRLAAFVEQRCRILETAMPVRRAAELQEPFSHVERGAAPASPFGRRRPELRGPHDRRDARTWHLA
jgi:AcrR family transcriptional regulator